MKYDLEGKCLIEISGEGCDACYVVVPECREVAREFGLKFVRISAEDNPQAIEEFSVERIPTIILAEDGKVIAKCSGYQPFEILELWVQTKLGI